MSPMATQMSYGNHRKQCWPCRSPDGNQVRHGATAENDFPDVEDELAILTLLPVPVPAAIGSVINLAPS